MEAFVFAGAAPLLMPAALICVPVGICLCCCLARQCMNFRVRDISCVKRCLRCCGGDSFDDFNAMILVHEVVFDQRSQKNSVSVRITSGDQFVQTTQNSNGIFQEPLQLLIEQGTEEVLFELLDSRSRTLAELKLDPLRDFLKPHSTKKLEPETVHSMKPKKVVTNPRIKLSIVLEADDAECGLLGGSAAMSAETAWQVRQQLAKTGGEDGSSQSEVQVLAQACQGPLDLFEGLGRADTKYVGVTGPPEQKSWLFGIYGSQTDFDKRVKPNVEISMLKVRSVQVDPSRSNVFTLSYFDQNRVIQQLTFRRIDRSRDVWVEMITLLTRKVHDEAKSTKRSVNKQAKSSV